MSDRTTIRTPSGAEAELVFVTDDTPQCARAWGRLLDDNSARAVEEGPGRRGRANHNRQVTPAAA